MCGNQFCVCSAMLEMLTLMLMCSVRSATAAALVEGTHINCQQCYGSNSRVKAASYGPAMFVISVCVHIG